MALPQSADCAFRRFVWLALALRLFYLCVAATLPVIQVLINWQLPFGNGKAGLAEGVAFASTILTRGRTGGPADHRSKACMAEELVANVSAALVCYAASWRGLPPQVAYGLLSASSWRHAST